MVLRLNYTKNNCEDTNKGVVFPISMVHLNIKNGLRLKNSSGSLTRGVGSFHAGATSTASSIGAAGQTSIECC